MSEQNGDNDPVNHPRHYTSHPSGVECIDIIEHMTLNCGSAVKYLWRAGLKKDALGNSKENREIQKRQKELAQP